MTISHKLCIIINTLAIIQCVITTVIIYVKAKKTPELYSLIICNVTMILWLFFVIIEKISSNLEQEFIAMKFVAFPSMFIIPE